MQKPQDILGQGTVEVIIKQLACIGEHLQTFPIKLTSTQEDVLTMQRNLLACIQALIEK